MRNVCGDRRKTIHRRRPNKFFSVSVFAALSSIGATSGCAIQVRALTQKTKTRSSGTFDTRPAADALFGATSFTRDLNVEYGVYSPKTPLVVGGKVLLIDSAQHRILGWNSPPTSPGRLPDFILGQTSSVLGAPNGSINATKKNGTVNTPNAWSFSTPNGMCSDGTRLVVADRGNNRVLIWNSIPTAAGVNADVVLGQPDFVSNTANNGGASAKSLNAPWDAFCADGRLFVPDRTNNRILFWNAIPSANFAAADGVLGQPDFTTVTAGTTASTLSSPTSVAVYSGKLLVADPLNNRIAVWNTSAPASAQAMDYVLGQPSTTVATANNGGVSAHSLSNPSNLGVVGTGLYVSDFANNRVLVWNSMPASAAVDADQVIGQSNFASNSPNTGGVTGQTLYGPQGVASDGTRLYLADSNNHRMLIFDTVPSGNSPAADSEYGQWNLNLNADRAGSDPSVSMNRPFGLSSSGGYAWAVDSRYHRVLRFPLGRTPFDGFAPDLVLGQSSLSVVSAGTTSSTTTNPTAVASDGTRVYVADCNNYRILVWTAMPSSSGTAASAALGQASFTVATQNAGGISAHSLSCVYDLTIDSGKLIAADYNNNRVLIWNSLPTTNAADADVVLGQALFTTAMANTVGLSASAMGLPACVRVYAGKLFVCDRTNHRILVWNSVPSANNTPADYAIGQSDLVSGSPDAGSITPYASGLNQPVGLAYRGHRLFVSDYGNNRVLVWNRLPTESGIQADGVIGQPDFQAVGPNYGGISSRALNGPVRVEIDGGDLWVGDYANNRLLRYKGED